MFVKKLKMSKKVIKKMRKNCIKLKKFDFFPPLEIVSSPTWLFNFNFSWVGARWTWFFLRRLFGRGNSRNNHIIPDGNRTQINIYTWNTSVFDHANDIFFTHLSPSSHDVVI